MARRSELLGRARSILKMEMRDDYAVDRVMFAAWRAGDTDRVARAAGASRRRVAARVEAGMSLRRVKVVSEPLSEYQRFAFECSTRAVDPREELRWAPRRLVSGILMPGNDFFLLDDEMVIFNVLDGADRQAEQQLSTAAEMVKLCREAFESAWAVAIPHHEYGPR
nr:hypothetical protein GCM10010200_108280 [Actinomadura rugatobispora]